MSWLALVQEDPQALYNSTNVHPVGLLALVALVSARLLAPRRWAVVPILLLVCLVPTGQRIVVAGADFSFLRVAVLAGWLRLLVRGEYRGLRAHPLDWLLASLAVVGTLIYTLRWGSGAALVYQLGQSYDAFGLYFLYRCLLRSWGDLRFLVLGLTLISFVVVVLFAIEKSTGRNLFSVLGGVPALTQLREGRLRCQGAFSHPILAGVFWASVLPLVASRWWSEPRKRVLTAFGVLNCLLIVLFSASSTPFALVALVIVAGLGFPLRRELRLLRWGTAFTLLALHLVMTKPVWHLISRIDLVGGSTGWHRYYLMDQAIRRVGEWWLLGTRSTAHWGWGLQDVTNQYVLVGVRSGLLGLVLFVAMIAVALFRVGRIRARTEGDPRRLALTWSLGCSLFAQSIGFLAVSYFGQVIAIWYLILAAVASLDQRSLLERTHRARTRRVPRVRARAAGALQG